MACARSNIFFFCHHLCTYTYRIPIIVWIFPLDRCPLLLEENHFWEHYNCRKLRMETEDSVKERVIWSSDRIQLTYCSINQSSYRSCFNTRINFMRHSFSPVHVCLDKGVCSKLSLFTYPDVWIKCMAAINIGKSNEMLLGDWLDHPTRSSSAFS